MYFFELVCIFLLILFPEVHTTEECNKDCTQQCPPGMIPDFCTKQGSNNSRECVKDDREGMTHGNWDVDYNKGYRCILRCKDRYIASGCNVQRGWKEEMPTCVEDDWGRKLKDWGKTGLKVGTGLAAGAGVVAATPALLGVLGFGAAGVTAGSVAAGIQSSTTAAGSIFAWAQSVGAVGYVGGTGTAVIGGGTGTTATYIVSAITGCEAE